MFLKCFKNHFGTILPNYDKPINFLACLLLYLHLVRLRVSAGQLGTLDCSVLNVKEANKNGAHSNTFSVVQSLELYTSTVKFQQIYAILKFCIKFLLCLRVKKDLA